MEHCYHISSTVFNPIALRRAKVLAFLSAKGLKEPYASYRAKTEHEESFNTASIKLIAGVTVFYIKYKFALFNQIHAFNKKISLFLWVAV